MERDSINIALGTTSYMLGPLSEILSSTLLRKRYNMIRELAPVLLTHDIAEHGLTQGDVRAVVHCYKEGAAFEVEFVTAEGRTVALLTLHRVDVRPIDGMEVLHVREWARVAA